jgi:hypothetical protein
LPEEVTMREDLELIHVRSYADVTNKDFKRTLDSILGIREERGFAKVLVDATKVTSYPATLSVFDFARLAADSLRGKGIRVSVVVALDQRDETEFFETAARNRGGSIRVFDSTDAALAWLAE